MLSLKKSKLPIILLCVAVLGLAFLALGGDFLHAQIHNHEQGTEQQCPFYHFLIQALITLIVVLSATVIEKQRQIFETFQISLPKVFFSLPSLRAPPTV